MFRRQLVALVAAALLVAAVTAPPVAASAVPSRVLVEKRGVGSWFDKWVIGPLIDRTRPIVEHEMAAAMDEGKTEFIKDMPEIFRDSFRKMFKLAPIASDKDNRYDCGRLLQWACDSVVTPINNKISDIQREASRQIDEILADGQEHMVNVTLKAIKKQLYFSEEARAALLHKRGVHDWYRNAVNAAKGWYHGKVNRFMSNVLADVRPEIHVLVLEVKQKYMAMLPASIETQVNGLLPESLQVQVPVHVAKRDPFFSLPNPVTAIKRKVSEWLEYLLSGVRTRIDASVVALENKIMATIIKITKKRIAEIAPLMDEEDVHLSIPAQ